MCCSYIEGPNLFFFVPPIVLSRFLYAHVLINTIILSHAYEFNLHCACGCLGPVICRTFHGHNADANNGDNGGLGRHRGHYDVTVMILMILKVIPYAGVDSLPSNCTNYFVNSGSGIGLMPTPQAIAWTNGDLRLLTSITFVSTSFMIITP